MRTTVSNTLKILSSFLMLLCWATTIEWHWHSGIAPLPEEAPIIESRSGPR